MNNYPGAHQGAVADAPEVLPHPRIQQRRHPHDIDSSSSFSSSSRLTSPLRSPSLIPQATRNFRTSGGGNAPLHLDTPEDYYKDSYAGSTNFEPARENILSAASHNSSSNMANTMAPALKPKPSSSRVNGNGTPSNLSIQRKEHLKPVGSRSASDPSSQKLHAAKSSPAMGVGTTRVKEMANKFSQKAESGNIQSKSIASPPPKPINAYRQPNGSPISQRLRAVSDNHTRVTTTKAGQATRDEGARAQVRATARSKFAEEDQESTTTASRVVASTQTSRIRKPLGNSAAKPAPKTSSSPPKLRPTGERPLFGSVTDQTGNGVGYGIPAFHARGSSDPAARVVPDTSSQLHLTSTDHVPNVQKSTPHTRTSSDTSGRRMNGVIARRPVHQPPSSHSSTCSETSRKVGPSASRLPTSKRLSNSTSTSSPSSTRSNSPFTNKTVQKGTGPPNPRPWSPNGRSYANGTTTKSRYNPITNSSPRGSPEHTKSPPRPSRAPYRTVADKSTSASRNRERETSRNRTASLSGSPRKRLSPPKTLPRQNNLPLDKVDFASRQKEVRDRYSISIHKQEQTEIRRQQSLRIENSRRIPREPNKDENTNGVEEDEKGLASVAEVEPIPAQSEVNSQHENKASESLPLRIDTSPVSETIASLSIAEVLGRPDDDSPTLGIPGSFPSAQPSPMFEEAPQSAVSNATETTDIENDPQDNFQIPGSFDATISRPQSVVSGADTFPSDPPDDYKEESDCAQMPLDAQNNTITQSIVVCGLGETSEESSAENVAVLNGPSIDDSGQYLIPDNHEIARYRVHESLRDPDDESLYEGRSYPPSDSFPRTPQNNDLGSRHSAAWTDYSVTTASDADAGQSPDEKPPTPPPKLGSIRISTTGSLGDFDTLDVRPTTPLNPLSSRHASPQPTLPPTWPEVPPKPATYSPLPSPRMLLPSPRLNGEDVPLSPRSGFGTAAVISSHRRTSSTTPHYAPGMGWIAQPPVPNSRPTSAAFEKSSNGSSASLRTSPNNEPEFTTGGGNSSTSLQMEEQALATQKETKVLRDRQNIIREIIDSEAKHVKDMYVIKEIWQGTADACPKLTEADKTILFGNINEIAAFGARFLEKLKKANSAVYEGRRTASDSSRTSSEDTLVTASNDRLTCVGGVFVQFMREIESVNWPFIIKFQDGQNHLETLLRDPAINIWDQECRRAMVDISECWDLKSLIIKPFQRIIKYKDLLERLATKTGTEHPDWANLQKAISDVKDVLARLNQAMPSPEPPQSIAKSGGKRKETDNRTGFMKALARKTIKSPSNSGNKLADDEQEYAKLRTTFSDEYVRLQVVLRDVEFYTRQVHDFVTSFLRILSSIEVFLLSKPLSTYPELESKWTRFNISMQSMKQTVLPEHIAAVRTQFISPFEQLIQLYTNPNIRMGERAKRRLDWEKIIQKKGTISFSKDSLKSKTEKNAERYVVLNEQLMKELPVLSIRTNEIANICLGNFVRIQTDFQNLWVQMLRTVLEDSQIPSDVKSIMDSFFHDFAFLDASMKELRILNSVPMGRSSTQEAQSEQRSITKSRDSREQRSRPPSSNGRTRPPPLNTGAGSSTRTRRAASTNEPLIPTPDFGNHNNGVFITPIDPNHPEFHNAVLQSVNGLGISKNETGSLSDTLVNSQPASIYQSSGRPSTSQNSTSRTSTSRSRPPPGGLDGAYDEPFRQHSDVSDSAYKARDVDSGYYYRRESDPSLRSIDYYDKSRPVSGSTTFSSRVDGPPLNGRPPSGLDGPAGSNPLYSGVFQSAMPLSDGPDTYNTRMSRASSLSSLNQNDDRGRGDGYNVLYLAASLFEFHIADTKREGIYPYLTYEAGELFDVIGEKGELWLAKNQDDPPDKIKVGWIWSKHFARLAD